MRMGLKLKLYGGVAAAGLLLSGAALAEDFVVGSGPPVGQQVLPNAGDTLLIEQGGTVSTSGSGNNTSAVWMQNTDQVTTNKGTISTTGNDSYGIFSTGANAMIKNSGLISTKGVQSSGIRSTGANAYISNNDLIMIEGAISHGMIASGADTKMDNSGSIITLNNDSWGMSISGANSHLSNSGSISTTGNDSYGILSFGNITDNSGSISTTGNDSYGIWSRGANAKTDNSGSISTTGNGGHGILSDGSNAMISNSGSISTTGINAYGIYSTSTNAQISNSGSIISAQSDAIRMSGADATLNLFFGSAIQGGIAFGNPGSATLNVGPGLNTYYLLTGVPDTITVNGMPVAGAGNAVLDGNILAVVDPTGFASTYGTLTDLTRSITGSVEGHLSAQRSCYRDGRVTVGSMSIAPVADLPPVPMTCGTGMWGTIFGGYNDRQASGPVTDAEHGFGGLLVGFDGALSQATVGGLFAGFSKGEVSTPHDVFSNDITGAYGGAYLSHATGGLFFDLSVTAGVLMNETERLVGNNLVAGGIDTASADYDGIVFSPSMKVGFDQGLGGSTLTPSVRVRYAGLYLDGYRESGATVANLTVADRDVHVLEVRGELALSLATREVESGVWNTQLKGGVDGIFNWGDDVNASLSIGDLAFAAGVDDSIVRGFGGAEAVFTSHGGTQFTAGFEAGYDSAETFTADARLGVNVPF